MDKLLSDFRVRLSQCLPPKITRAVYPFLTVQFFIFMGLGIVNTATLAVTATVLDVIKSLVLSPDGAVRIFIEHFRINFMVGYAASIVLSFFLNSKYTFLQKPTFKRFIKFPISYIPNFIFQYIFVLIFTSIHLNTIFAYIIAAILGTPITFLTIKFMVFRKK